MHGQLLGIDWGTSNRRAYLIAQDGQCLARHEDDQGMLAVGGRFAESLAALLQTMQIADKVPVVMSGMVGSASGWQEVPYLGGATALEEIPAHLARVRDHGLARDCMIVPGYCIRGDGLDVMRGEETQLLGAVLLGQRDGALVLPGTHSKWVALRDGVVERLATYMTGELFAMLAAGGTLSALMKGDAENEAAFAAGVDSARQRAPLSNSLFRVRAAVVAGAMPAAEVRSFVSGLLIGTEFFAAFDAGDQEALNGVTLIASKVLSERYATVAGLFDLRAQALDPDRVYCAALTHILQRLAA